MLTAIGVPYKIKIKREKNYHTHNIGKAQDGIQFMGFVVGVGGHGRQRAEQKLQWYAVLHRFDADGNHLRTEVSFLGKETFATQLEEGDAKLAAMIKALGRVRYCDVEVKLFSVKNKEIVFGLIDASDPTAGYQRVDLVPNGLAFFPPWDGTYET